jgi:hypothetical protein
MPCWLPCVARGLIVVRMRAWRCFHLSACRPSRGERQSTCIRWNGFALRAMLMLSGVPCKCVLPKDCFSCQLHGAGLGRARASSVRASTCACCPPALDLVSSPATSPSLAKILVRIVSPSTASSQRRVELDDPAHRDPRRRPISIPTSRWAALAAQQNLPRRLQ